MLIKKKKSFNFKESLVTEEKYYLNRRKLIKGLGSLLIFPSFTPSLLSKNNDYNITTREPTKYEILTKAFPDIGILDIYEYLDIHMKHFAQISYIYLLHTATFLIR